MLKAFGGVRKILKYLRRQFAECRRLPRPGMLSALVAAELEGDQLTEEELLATAILLLLAGHETTVHLMTGGLMTLEQHPEQKAKLLADWSLADSAVDEILRYYSSVQMTKPRYAVRDIEIYGQLIRQGEFFMPLLAAANCDPAEFPAPETFEIARQPNRHLAFGTGPHLCLGVQLAKAEVGIAYERLYTRFPELRLPQPAEQLEWIERIGTRSVAQLPILLGGRHL